MRLNLACLIGCVMAFAMLSSGCQILSGPPLVLRNRDAIEHIDHMDKEGHFVFTKYEGKCVVVDTTVSALRLPWKSLSMCIDNDVAWFVIAPGQTIPNLPKYRTIELTFDRFSMYPLAPAARGEKWKVTLTEDNRLVRLERTWDQLPKN